MKMNRDFKPWLTCASPKEAGRESIQHPWLDVEKALLISTNGKILSKLAVEITPGDISGRVPVDAIKAALKIKTAYDTVLLDCSDKAAVKIMDGRTWPRADAAFPNWEQVVPNNAGHGTARLILNASLLADLQAALGGDDKAAITLEFQLDDEHDAKPLPILATCNGETGVIMPMKDKSRAPNRLDDIEQAHAAALGKDINEIDAENAAKAKAAAVHVHKFNRVMGRGEVCACGFSFIPARGMGKCAACGAGAKEGMKFCDACASSLTLEQKINAEREAAK